MIELKTTYPEQKINGIASKFTIAIINNSFEIKASVSIFIEKEISKKFI